MTTAELRTYAGPGQPLLPMPERFGGIRQAERWTRECWPHLVEVNFDGMTARGVLPVLRQLQRLSARWPEPMGRLGAIVPLPDEEIGGTINRTLIVNPRKTVQARISGNDRLMELNPRYFGQPDKLLEALREGERTGFHPCGCDTIESLISHEFGHMLDGWLSNGDWNKPQAPTHIPSLASFSEYASMWSLFGPVSDTFRSWKRTVRARNLSGYAAVSRRETDLSGHRRFDSEAQAQERFAEGFTSLMHTPPSSQVPYVRKLAAVLAALSRSNWVSDDDVRWLHDLDSGAQQGGVETLTRYAKSFGMTPQLLKPQLAAA